MCKCFQRTVDLYSSSDVKPVNSFACTGWSIEGIQTWGPSELKIVIRWTVGISSREIQTANRLDGDCGLAFVEDSSRTEMEPDLGWIVGRHIIVHQLAHGTLEHRNCLVSGIKSTVK
jgi:hypothetical protein